MFHETRLCVVERNKLNGERIMENGKWKAKSGKRITDNVKHKTES